MGVKSEEEQLRLKQTNLETQLLDGEVAAIEALRALVADKNVDAGVRLSASHLLLQARAELRQRPDETTP